MAEKQENQEKKQKPKATLIKHKKSEQSPSKKSEEQKTEKKKVVVVKKKVVVKKSSAKVTVSKEEEKKVAPAEKEDKNRTKKAISADRDQTSEKRRPQHSGTEGDKREYQRKDYKSRDTRPQRGQNRNQYDRKPDQRDYRNNRQGTGQRDSGGYNRDRGGNRRFPQQGRGDSKPGFRKDTRPGGSRPGGSRPGGSRPGGSRPGGSRPPMGRGGAGSAPAPSADKTLGKTKGANKKFFKAKKKSGQQWSKKENEIKEKNFQLKKKTIQKTNPVPKEIDIMEVITVSELARKMNLKASELISKLMGMGMMVTINEQIDAETAEILATDFECKVNIVSLYDETIIESEKDTEEDLTSRAPIVTVMGHVDHGKTKLLDAIRTTNVVDSEFGGITQHIGAYKVSFENGEIVFLDTPGHEAFTLMRARGAQITDIVVLVVAANDGVMPQTVEAINHAKDAGVPIIVAINKVDLPEANTEKVKKQLADYDLLPEEWGGSTIFVEISALKRLGIENLLESIVLQAEVLELKVNNKCRAEGKVIESKVDHGRGIVSSVLIERGTLKVGDAFIAGIYPGKVRAMFNDRGKKIQIAPPATPVEILGFSGIPNSGDPFQVTENEKVAKQVGAKRQELEKIGAAKSVKKITLDNLYDSIQEGGVQELKVIIKGDVHGSVEALKNALEKLSTHEIRLHAIHASAGAIIENDVNLATASNAIIIGFHVRPTPKALTLAEQEKVEIRKYNIIYDAVEDIKNAMEGLLAPELKEETIGVVEVRETFKVPKIGVIAGCYVQSGKITRGASTHVIRDGIQIFTGKVSSLRRFKDDAKEVVAGYECGVGIENFPELKVGDQFEVFEIKEIAKKLENRKKGDG